MAIYILCKHCKGKGRIPTKIPFISIKCNVCNGTGKLKKKKHRGA